MAQKSFEKVKDVQALLINNIRELPSVFDMTSAPSSKTLIIQKVMTFISKNARILDKITLIVYFRPTQHKLNKKEIFFSYISDW